MYLYTMIWCLFENQSRVPDKYNLLESQALFILQPNQAEHKLSCAECFNFKFFKCCIIIFVRSSSVYKNILVFAFLIPVQTFLKNKNRIYVSSTVSQLPPECISEHLTMGWILYLYGVNFAREQRAKTNSDTKHHKNNITHFCGNLFHFSNTLYHLSPVYNVHGDRINHVCKREKQKTSWSQLKQAQLQSSLE